MNLARELLEWMRSHPDLVVALSGGVDSAVVAAAAYRALGNRAMAITGIGEALSDSDRQSSRDVCRQIGIRHLELITNEIDNPDYTKNDARRCYHCKKTLYETLWHWASNNGFVYMASGTNADDLGDYRPGLDAGKEYRVLTPLADLQIGKFGVRELARHFELSVADKPASPCLASRIAYGQEVTTARLRQIESLERLCVELGFYDVRVRVHADELVRLELHRHDWHKLLDEAVRANLTTRCRELGFQFVTMDLMSRQTGSLNRVLPVLSD